MHPRMISSGQATDNVTWVTKCHMSHMSHANVGFVTWASSTDRVSTLLPGWTLPRTMFDEHCSIIVTVDKSTVHRSWFRCHARVYFLVSQHVGGWSDPITRITMWTHRHFIRPADIIRSVASGFKFHIGNHKYYHVDLPVHLIQLFSCIIPWLITYLRSVWKAQSS